MVAASKAAVMSAWEKEKSFVLKELTIFQLEQVLCSHRIMERNGLGWKRPKRSSSSNSSAMGRDTFH